ncbi:ABC transporter permease, partial [Dehalococcoidia bacterium]|nr:ABC transporter permease [Dehalococcoidia bacterium]
HVWMFCRKRPLGAAGGIVLVVVVLAAIFAPLVATHDPIAQDHVKFVHPPGQEFLFGSDNLGRDVFSRIVYGARVSMHVGMLSVIGGTVIGTLLGVVSAYIRGWFDLVLQRFVDTIQGIPGLVFIMLMVLALGASLNNVTIAIGFSFLVRMIRVARATALSVQEQDYVLAAHAIGASHTHIIIRHVTPNSLTPSIVLAAALLGTAIVAEAGLSFLGLGVPPPHPSWGRALQLGARGYMELAPWLVIFPGLVLTLTVFGFNLFGDALRDTLDPRLRGR